MTSLQEYQFHQALHFFYANPLYSSLIRYDVAVDNDEEDEQ